MFVERANFLQAVILEFEKTETEIVQGLEQQFIEDAIRMNMEVSNLLYGCETERAANLPMMIVILCSFVFPLIVCIYACIEV